MKRWYIARSAIAGRGIFASVDIPAGGFILTATGKVLRRTYDSPATSAVERLLYPLKKNTWLNPDIPIRFLNHSCNANAGFMTPRRMYACRDIKKGEEITVDFSTIDYVEFWKMPCKCGAPNCRKVVRSIQFLPAGDFLRYLPNIPLFLQRIYRRANQTALPQEPRAVAAERPRKAA
jgi:uncharacterized protein